MPTSKVNFCLLALLVSGCHQSPAQPPTVYEFHCAVMDSESKRVCLEEQAATREHREPEWKR